MGVYEIVGGTTRGRAPVSRFSSKLRVRAWTHYATTIKTWAPVTKIQKPKMMSKWFITFYFLCLKARVRQCCEHSVAWLIRLLQGHWAAMYQDIYKKWIPLLYKHLKWVVWWVAIFTLSWGELMLLPSWLDRITPSTWWIVLNMSIMATLGKDYQLLSSLCSQSSVLHLLICH